MKTEKEQFSALSTDKAGVQIEEETINKLEEKVARLQQELSEKEVLIIELKEKLAAAE